jgi:hypothetical protein
MIIVNDFITEIQQKLTEQASADGNGKHVLQGHVKCRGLWNNLAAPLARNWYVPLRSSNYSLVKAVLRDIIVHCHYLFKTRN